MKEIKNEVIAEETNEVAVPEEKVGIVKKVWSKVKKAAPVVIAAVVGFGAGALLSKHGSGNSEDCGCADCDVIDADDYTVEDAE